MSKVGGEPLIFALRGFAHCCGKRAKALESQAVVAGRRGHGGTLIKYLLQVESDQSPAYTTDGQEKPTNHLHTCMERKLIEEINFLEWEDRILVWVQQAVGCGYSGRGVDTRGCFLLRLLKQTA